MKSTTKRFLSMIVGLVLIVAALVLYFDSIVPAYDELQKSRGEQIAREELLSEQQSAIQQVKTLISNTRSQADLRQVLNNSLPFTPDPAQLVAQISSLAASSGATITNMGVSVANQAAKSGSGSLVQPVGVATVQLKLDGSYESIKNFIRLIETSIRVMEIRSLNLQPPAKANEGKYALDMEIEAYYQVPPVLATTTKTTASSGRE